MNFAKFLRTRFPIEHLRWLVLLYAKSPSTYEELRTSTYEELRNSNIMTLPSSRTLLAYKNFSNLK